MTDRMPQPKVSIIVCNYNQEAYVAEAIDSALKQTYNPLEIIVIDNGSTDGSPLLLEKYRTFPNIKLLLNQANAPVTQRLNEGIRAATGEFISILYADDYYLTNKIARQIQVFQSLDSDYGVVYSPGTRLNQLTKKTFPMLSLKESGNILNSMFRDYHRCGPIDPISPLVRKACFLRYPFREHVFIEGEGIYFRIALSFKFKYLDEPLTVMRDHLENAGKAIKKTKEYEVKLISELLNEKEFPSSSKKYATDYMARVLRNYAWQSLRLREETKWARGCYYEAVQWNPKQALHPRTLVGLILSFLPVQILTKINQLASRALNRPGILLLKENNV